MPFLELLDFSMLRKLILFFFFVILCQVVCASIFKYVLHDQALESRIARDTFNDDFQKKKTDRIWSDNNIASLRFVRVTSINN